MFLLPRPHSLPLVTADRATLELLLSPKSVAVIGAGRVGLGRLVLEHLVDGGFTGETWVVHPTRDAVAGVAAFPSPRDLPGRPDLAVIALGRDRALEAVSDCAERGCRAAILVSAGFAEIGAEGARVQAEMVKTARKAGMRLLGPNCMGLINTREGTSLNASFGVAPVPRGQVAVITQSGSVGDYFLYHCHRWELGVSILASVGNEADLTLGDLVHAAADDDATKVVACYLEQPSDPSGLLESIRRCSARKPVVVLRAGRTPTGAAAASSHTGKLIGAADGVTVGVFLEKAGALLVTTLEELMAACRALASFPEGAGSRVAVLTNAGGPGVLAADELVSAGMELAPTPLSLRRNAGHLMPTQVGFSGPVLDLTASALPEHFGAAVKALGDDVDSLLCLIMSPEGTDPDPAVKAVLDGWRRPLAFSLLARGEGVEKARKRLAKAGATVVREPRLAVKALRALTARHELLCRGIPKARIGAADSFNEAERIVETAARRGRDVLRLHRAFALAEVLGIPIAPYEVVEDEHGALGAADKLGLPVFIKLDVPGLVHRTEMGAVKGPLRSTSAVSSAVGELRASHRWTGDGSARLIIQKHIDGLELLCGASHSESWGTVALIGRGGIDAEIMDDVAYLVPPLSQDEVVASLRDLRIAPLLEDYRGTGSIDLKRVASLLLPLSDFVGASQHCIELELSPFIAGRGGSLSGAVDVRVVISHSSR